MSKVTDVSAPTAAVPTPDDPSGDLNAGQVTQLNDVWSRYGLPASATSLLVNVAEVTGTAQIRGYISVKDTFTSDGSFFFMPFGIVIPDITRSRF